MKDKVIANLEVFDFDGVFHEAGKLLNWHGGLCLLDFFGKRDRIRIFQIQTKFCRGIVVHPRTF